MRRCARACADIIVEETASVAIGESVAGGDNGPGSLVRIRQSVRGRRMGLPDRRHRDQPPLAARPARRPVLPLAIAVGYALAIMAAWSGSEGGFASLTEVRQL